MKPSFNFKSPAPPQPGTPEYDSQVQTVLKMLAMTQPKTRHEEKNVLFTMRYGSGWNQAAVEEGRSQYHALMKLAEKGS